jgi:hypothetical protein
MFTHILEECILSGGEASMVLQNTSNCTPDFIIIIIIIIPYHLCLFVVCFFAIMWSCNLSLTLCCVCPLCSYVYLHCAVSVIGLIAVDSAHK